MDSLATSLQKSEITINVFAEYEIINISNKDLVGELVITRGKNFDDQQVKKLAEKKVLSELDRFDQQRFNKDVEFHN